MRNLVAVVGRDGGDLIGAGRIDDGFTLIVDDKLCFWKIEYSLQAPSTSTTRQPTLFFREICIEAGAQEEKALQIS